MRRFAAIGTVSFCILLLLAAAQAIAGPDETMRAADEVLHESMAITARQIPESLLAEAQGVAIIPDVIKVGLVAGIRRGHGVVMVRNPDGQWSLPQFVVLTGGSVGWQAGIQGTDVILVFMTRKSVDGMMRGKFTIGADAAAAAGPVGRNAAAATDARLKAEILSYSRSRGLFVGLSLDGSAIEIDSEAQVAYYGAVPGQAPAQVPEPANRLYQDLVQLTQLGNPVPQQGGLVPATGPVPTLASNRVPTLRQLLAKNAKQLFAVVDPPWQQYLALPKEVFEPGEPPRVEVLQKALQQYDQVAQSPKYQALSQRPEFQSTYEVLREYAQELAETSRRQIDLPPPPRS